MLLSILSLADQKVYQKFLDKIITDNYNYLQDAEYDMETINSSSDISESNSTLSQKTGKNISIKRATLPKIHLYLDNNHNFSVFYQEHKIFFDKLLADMSQDLDVDVWINGRRVSLDDVDLHYKDYKIYDSYMWDIITTIKQIWWVSVVISDMLDIDLNYLQNIDDLYILSWDMKVIWLDYNIMYIK